MKIGYSPVSIFAQLCGSAAAAAAAAVSPTAAGAAAGVGTFVSAIFGGIELKEEEKNIRADLTCAMDTAWETVQKKYDLTEGCIAELKTEIMGERTSVGEFIRNSQHAGVKNAVTVVIESILLRYTEDLNKNTGYVWGKSFTHKAALEIAAILIGAVEDVFENNDSLRILKAIADSDAGRREDYREISDQLDTINNKVDLIFDTENGANTSAGKARHMLPAIKESLLPPCEPFIEGNHRAEDITNIYALLTGTNKPLWLYGDRGTGRTELVRKFASLHPEYVYIHTTFRGSINQTVSQNLFFLSEYERNGTELEDVVRYQKNMSVFSEYSRRLKEEQRGLILIVDNYDPVNYEEACRKETGVDMDNGISGEKNDIREINELLKTGIRVVLMAQKKPGDSDVFASYEIRSLDEADHFAVMTGCYTRIEPFINEEGVREKLLYLIRCAGKRTVFVTIMAFAMQNSKLAPKEALNKMMEVFDADEAYGLRYSLDTLNMHEHLERILKFIGFSYQEKQLLAILAMLPVQGMELGLFRQLMASNAAQLDKIRQAALQKFTGAGIVTEENRQGGSQASAGEKKYLRMSPLIAEHAIRVLEGDGPTTLLDSIRANWVTRLLHYIDEDDLENLKKDDRRFPQIPALADTCSAAEQKLKKLGERFGCDEKVAVSRRNLLMKASELCDKAGNVKDALEYVERAIAVEGPYAEDMNRLIKRTNSVGQRYFKGGKYDSAEKCFANCLRILDDRNSIVPEENVKSLVSYDVEELIQSNDGASYATLFGNMGSVYLRQGTHEKWLERYDKAVEYYGRALICFDKALAIRKRVLGINHPDTATAYRNMAMAFYDLCNYEKALEYCNKALAISERVLGTSHPDTATTYNNMAGIYEKLGEYERALEYCNKALAISERVLGTSHPDTAITYNNMAGMFIDQGDFERGIYYYKKAYEILLKKLGEAHPKTKTVKYNIERTESDLK